MHMLVDKESRQNAKAIRRELKQLSVKHFAGVSVRDEFGTDAFSAPRRPREQVFANSAGVCLREAHGWRVNLSIARRRIGVSAQIDLLDDIQHRYTYPWIATRRPCCRTRGARSSHRWPFDPCTYVVGRKGDDAGVDWCLSYLGGQTRNASLDV